MPNLDWHPDAIIPEDNDLPVPAATGTVRRGEVRVTDTVTFWSAVRRAQRTGEYPHFVMAFEPEGKTTIAQFRPVSEPVAGSDHIEVRIVAVGDPAKVDGYTPYRIENLSDAYRAAVKSLVQWIVANSAIKATDWEGIDVAKAELDPLPGPVPANAQPPYEPEVDDEPEEIIGSEEVIDPPADDEPPVDDGEGI
jgi:hypothetical protein